MKLTREVDIYQCPVSTKYCFLSFRWLEPNTVQMADYVRVWHGEIELDDAPEGLVEMDIQKAICEKCFCRFQNGQDKTFLEEVLQLLTLSVLKRITLLVITIAILLVGS